MEMDTSYTKDNRKLHLLNILHDSKLGSVFNFINDRGVQLSDELTHW